MGIPLKRFRRSPVCHRRILQQNYAEFRALILFGMTATGSQVVHASHHPPTNLLQQERGQGMKELVRGPRLG
jgi:hypothetical protein